MSFTNLLVLTRWPVKPPGSLITSGYVTIMVIDSINSLFINSHCSACCTKAGNMVGEQPKLYVHVQKYKRCQQLGVNSPHHLQADM